MADIRIAVVTYHNEELKLGEGTLSIGQAIDNMVEAELKSGNLIQDVTLSLTEDERFELQRTYMQRTLDGGEPVVSDGHYGKGKKPVTKASPHPNY